MKERPWNEQFWGLAVGLRQTEPTVRVGNIRARTCFRSGTGNARLTAFKSRHVKAKLPPANPTSVETLNKGDVVFLPFNTSDYEDRRMVTACRVLKIQIQPDVLIVEPLRHYAVNGEERNAKIQIWQKINECDGTLDDAFVALVEHNETEGERLNQEALEYDRQANAARLARASVLRAANMIRPFAAARTRATTVAV